MLAEIKLLEIIKEIEPVGAGLTLLIDMSKKHSSPKVNQACKSQIVSSGKNLSIIQLINETSKYWAEHRANTNGSEDQDLEQRAFRIYNQIKMQRNLTH